MANFMFLYRHPADRYDAMPPDEMKLNLEKWTAWLNEGFTKGWLVAPGDGLKKDGRVVNVNKVVTDGPFVEAKEIVGGTTIVQAEGIDAAVEFAKGCPLLLTGGSVEVRPLEGYKITPGCGVEGFHGGPSK